MDAQIQRLGLWLATNAGLSDTPSGDDVSEVIDIIGNSSVPDSISESLSAAGFEPTEAQKIYTVFAVYEEDYQPYATAVKASTPDGAIELAQAQADEDNGAHHQLVGFQVVAGNVSVVA